MVEFHRLPNLEEVPLGRGKGPIGVRLEDALGLWRPVPVEYKRGQPKLGLCDEVQLCAQALCLEEMLDVFILAGAMFYGKPRRRYDVTLDDSLRTETERLAARLHQLTRAGKTPPPRYEKKCRNCSLLSFCLPKATGRRRSVGRYLDEVFAEVEKETT